MTPFATKIPGAQGRVVKQVWWRSGLKMLGIAGLAAVARATSIERYAVAAEQGRQWFHGRNSAEQPVYDAQHGIVFDGIDNGQVSRNSGAESNIEGALALLG